MASSVKNVAVIGAGVSGICTAAHLIKEGVNVTVFERASVSGGVWVFDSRTPLEPAYPSAKPSLAEHTFYEPIDDVDEEILYSSPGPCYEGLMNNVPTELSEFSFNAWKPGTESSVLHYTIAEYLQETAQKAGVNEKLVFNTRVERVSKEQDVWKVNSITWDPVRNEKAYNNWASNTAFPGTWIVADEYQTFDAVVVATGHYHAPVVPDIPGLPDWKRRWPSKVQHSKKYRSPKGFKNQVVLLIGGSTSANDIAKELGPIAKKIWQSTRNGIYDHPASWLPDIATRVGPIASFNPPGKDCVNDSSAISGTITLVGGRILEGIDQVIICTGYQFSLPFLPQFHRDDLRAEDADDKVLVTDGTMLHNLHRDIFYIPDPTLAFVGVPFRIATFSLFEFQAIAVAALFSGKATFPSEAEMRAEYKERVEKDGFGRPFHTLHGRDVEYVAGLMEWVNRGREPSEKRLDGYSKEWLERRDTYMQKLFPGLGHPTTSQQEPAL